jgi:hypothetical protein
MVDFSLTKKKVLIQMLIIMCAPLVTTSLLDEKKNNQVVNWTKYIKPENAVETGGNQL